MVNKTGAGLECYDIMRSQGVAALHPRHPVQDACMVPHQLHIADKHVC